MNTPPCLPPQPSFPLWNSRSHVRISISSPVRAPKVPCTLHRGTRVLVAMFRASPDDAAGLSVSDGLSDYYLPGMEPELIASSATSRAPRLRAGAHALALAEVCALVARGEYLEAERSLADIKEGRIIGQDPHAITFAWQAVLELVGKHLIPAEKKAAEMGYLRSGGVTYLERLLDTLDTRTKGEQIPDDGTRVVF